MLTRIAIAVGALALAAGIGFWLAPIAYTVMLEGRWPSVIRTLIMAFFGPGVGSLDIHSGPIWTGLGIILTVPWLLGYAASGKKWLLVAGVGAWMASGVLLVALML